MLTVAAIKNALTNRVIFLLRINKKIREMNKEMVINLVATAVVVGTVLVIHDKFIAPNLA